MGRLLFFFIVFLALPTFSEEYDILDKVRMEDDPNYMEYFKKKQQQKVVNKKAIEKHKKQREAERMAHEKARREYVRAKPKDQSEEEQAYLKLKEKEREDYLKLQKKYAIGQQQKRLEHKDLPTRLPASLMPPRIEKEKRKFK